MSADQPDIRPAPSSSTPTGYKVYSSRNGKGFDNGTVVNSTDMNVELSVPEVAAEVAEQLHHRLRAPVRRIGAPRMPVPYAPPYGCAGIIKVCLICRMCWV